MVSLFNDTHQTDNLFNSAVDEFKGLEPGNLYELDMHPDYSLYPFKLQQN